MSLPTSFFNWLRRDAKFIGLNAIGIILYGFLLIHFDRSIDLPFLNMEDFLIFICIPVIYSIFFYSRITFLFMLLITFLSLSWIIFFIDYKNYYQSFQTIVIFAGMILCVREIIHHILIKREHTEEALRESEGRYRTVVDHTDDFVWQIDINGSIKFASVAVKHMYGYDPNELLGKPFHILLNDESAQKAIESLDQRKRGEFGNRSIILELNHRRKDGTEFIAEVRSQPITDADGNITEIVGITRDITNRILAEKSLRESEDRFRSLFEQAPLGYQSLDINGNFIELNESWCKLLGYAKEEVIGRNFSDFLHPDFREVFLENFPKFRSIGYILGIEFEMIKKDGSEIIVSFDGKIGRNNDGSFKQTHCVLSDITNRKLAEDALHNSEALYSSLVEHLPQNIFRKDVDGKFTFVNGNFCETVGKSQNEIIGMTDYDLFPAELAKKFQDDDKRVMATGQLFETVEENISRRGEKRYVQVLKTQLRDLDGKTIGIQGIFWDVTGQKNTEELIKKERDRAQQYLDLAGAMFVSLDAQGRVELVNQNTLKILEYSKDEIIGKNWFDNFLPEKLRLEVKEYFDQIMRDEVDLVEFHENPILTKNGVEKIIAWHNTFLRDEQNRIIGILSSGEDITERKRAEEELLKARKLESIGILAGGIAHDFNNLLMAIIGNISLAKTLSDSPDDVAECLSEVEKASKRAQNLTQQLLTFSKGGAPIKENANVFDLVKETTTFSLRGSNSSCTFDFPENLWKVDVDKGQFSQVIQNLVINADQAMPEGGTIEIKSENITFSNNGANNDSILPEGDYIKLSIKDRGIGISEEYLQKIFDPYFSTKRQGSGLGLATTYSIMKNHDGHITVESQISTGTTFTLYLPRSSKESITTQETDHDKLETGQGRILVMDDEATIRKIVGRLLENIGYQVDYAEHGAEAIDKYQKSMASNEPFDALIMDLTIPGGMGGKEAILKLLEIDPQVKAIVSSGYSGDPVMADYKKYGFTGVISKPYKLEELGKALQRIF